MKGFSPPPIEKDDKTWQEEMSRQPRKRWNVRMKLLWVLKVHEIMRTPPSGQKESHKKHSLLASAAIKSSG